MQPGDSLDALAMRLAAYIGMREPDLGEPRVEGLERLGAGSSREMYRCRIIWPSSGSERRNRRLAGQRCARARSALAGGRPGTYASANGRLAGNLAPVDQAIAWWEAASGLTVDPEALRW